MRRIPAAANWSGASITRRLHDANATSRCGRSRRTPITNVQWRAGAETVSGRRDRVLARPGATSLKTVSGDSGNDGRRECSSKRQRDVIVRNRKDVIEPRPERRSAVHRRRIRCRSLRTISGDSSTRDGSSGRGRTLHRTRARHPVSPVGTTGFDLDASTLRPTCDSDFQLRRIIHRSARPRQCPCAAVRRSQTPSHLRSFNGTCPSRGCGGDASTRAAILP